MFCFLSLFNSNESKQVLEKVLGLFIVVMVIIIIDILGFFKCFGDAYWAYWTHNVQFGTQTRLIQSSLYVKIEFNQIDR